MAAGAGPTTRVGKGGRVAAAGPAARTLGLGFTGLALAGLVLSGLFFLHDRDLRDLGTLRTTTATVTDRDGGGKGQDYVDVRFTPVGQGEVDARIPSDTDASVGSEVDVAYRAEDPGRVRTVDEWVPAWQMALVAAVTIAVFGVPVLLFGVFSRLRHGRFEEGAPLPQAVVDAGLGTRIARSGHWIQLLWAGMGLVFGAGFVVIGFVVEGGVVAGTVSAAVWLLVTLGVAGWYQWEQGRDGVWASDADLVVHRRGKERRWPWDQVLELGVVQDKQSVFPVARLDDGFDDRVGPDGWVTLCKPVLGLLAAPVATRRLEALSVEHGVPFTEGVSGAEMADTLFGPWRVPSRRHR